MIFSLGLMWLRLYFSVVVVTLFYLNGCNHEEYGWWREMGASSGDVPIDRPKTKYTHIEQHSSREEERVKNSWAEEAKLIIVFHVIFDKYTQTLLTALRLAYTHSQIERERLVSYIQCELHKPTFDSRTVCCLHSFAHSLSLSLPHTNNLHEIFRGKWIWV